MKINLFDLYESQRKLDVFINKKHKTNYKKSFFSRMLAFVVEIGEFANETRCFKYWSLNKKISKQKILEEYIDGLHFLLSIGIPLKFDKKMSFQITKPSMKKLNLVKKILKIYYETIKLVDNYNFYQYKKVLKNYLEISYFLNLSLNEIIKIYNKKNKINYERQKNGY